MCVCVCVLSRYAEERAADRDRGRCEEILCVRTGSVASSRDTSLSRRGTSQERESSEDKGSQEANIETKKEQSANLQGITAKTSILTEIDKGMHPL